MKRTLVPIDRQSPSHNFRRFNDELLVDIASELVPSVPPHLWGSSESIIVPDHHPRNQKQEAQPIENRTVWLHGKRCEVCGGAVENQAAQTVQLLCVSLLVECTDDRQGRPPLR
jgi:hypothetical protein